MKQVLVSAVLMLGGFIFSNQCNSQNQSAGNVVLFSGTTSPAPISNEVFRFQPGITTHFLNGALPNGGLTGFGLSDRWLSFGQVVVPTQTLQGFRTQALGKGLSFGHSINTAQNPQTTGNPFIEWIGNKFDNIDPGNLEFNYARVPTGGTSATPIRVNMFTMVPSASGSATLNNNCYAQNGLLGHYENTSPINTPPSSFGTFGANDKWIGIGNPPVPNNPLYGMRTYWAGFSLNSAVREDNGVKNAIIEWGGDVNAVPSVQQGEMKFRFFSDNTNPNSAIPVLNLRSNGSSYFGKVQSGFYNNALVEVNGGQTVNDGLAIFTNPSSSVVNPTGVKVIAISGSNTGTNLYGVKTLAKDAATNFGILTRAESSQDNYGIYSEVVGGNNNIAGYFAGAVVSTSGFFTVSDRKFKTDIRQEESVLAKINLLTPVNYNFKKEASVSSYNLDSKFQHGFIADELEKVFPEMTQKLKQPIFEKGELVSKDEYTGVNYTMLIPVLTKAIQELSAKVNDLESKLSATTASNTLLLKENLLSNSEKLVLENKVFTLSQNVPNPFSEKTTITYSIPTNVTKAILAIFDLNGKMLQQYTLLQGKNQLTINGNSFAAGMYIYSLIADGQEVVSKRMILTK